MTLPSLLHTARTAIPTTAAAALVLTGVLDLPTGFVTSDSQVWLGELGAVSTVDIQLSGVPAGFDVANGPQHGWCIEDNHLPDAPNNSQVMLFDSTADEATLPPSYRGRHWDKVNYLLNHKNGNSVVDVQVAVWLLVDYFDGTFGAPSAAALQLVAEADAHGDGYVPGPSDIAAVLMFSDGMGPVGVQDTMIEVQVPGQRGCEGLTPGYWKNHTWAWAATGLSPCDDFDATFGVNYFSPNITLLQAAGKGGGGVCKIARHGTAALLNALHPEVDYPYTPGEVIGMVQAGNIEPLVDANELGCACGPVPPSHSHRSPTFSRFTCWLRTILHRLASHGCRR